MRHFIGTAQFYKKYIKGFSGVTKPLTDWTGKDAKTSWMPEVDQAFRRIKESLSNEPVLKLPEFEEPFKVHMDASDYAIGGVLMQKGRPVAYESKKLSETESRWPTHEKELFAVVYCLRKWRHYLGLHKTKVYTDNISLKYFETQDRVTPKQLRWHDTLALMNVDLIHKPGKDNIIPDALSRKEEYMSSSTQVLRAMYPEETSLERRIREGYMNDAQAQEYLEKLKRGDKIANVCLKDGLLRFKQSRIYVGEGKTMTMLLKESHDSPSAGHKGERSMLAILAKRFFWPNMKQETNHFVKTCVICQANRVSYEKKQGLLHPLPIPNRPWESVSMDFITSLPDSEGYNAILVIVDRFSKLARFVCTKDSVTAFDTSKLFLDSLWRLHGLPRSIVSDRDPKFTSLFWKHLFRRLGTKLTFSTAFHPQTDGQTKRVNSVLNQYLRNYVSADQQDWAQWLSSVEHCYNGTKHSATAMSPFLLAYDREPEGPLDLALGGSQTSAQTRQATVNELLADMQLREEQARRSLRKAQTRYIKQANNGRREVKYQVGERVWLSAKNFTLPEEVTPKFTGPFEFVANPFEDVYTLDLPPELAIHPTFHVSLLKKYYEDKLRPEQEQVLCPQPDIVQCEQEFEVETIVRSRRKGNQTEYLVKWRGYHMKEATWVLEANMEHAKQVLEDFKRR